jgi:hypothetical protein
MQGRLAGGNGDIKITEVQCTYYWQVLDNGLGQLSWQKRI